MNRKVVAGLVLVGILVALVLFKACATSHGSSATPSVPTASHAGASTTGRTGGAAPRTPASLAGRVTRASDGAGIAGAIVSVAPAELMAMFVTAESPTILAITDATGGWKAPRVMPGAYVVAATAAGFLPGTRAKLTVGSGEQRPGIDLVLTAGGMVVRGTVTDVGGGPISGARITATRSRVPELFGRADLVATSGADGRYELTLAEGAYDLVATHDDYTRVDHRVELAGAPMTVDFTLVPGAIIRGQVVARDHGTPVPGALVRGESGGRGGGGEVTALADDSGNFTLRGLTSGAIEISAFGRGYSSASPTVVGVAIGDQVDGVKVLVDRAYSISGRVVRKGKPAEGLPGVTLGAFSIAAKSFGLALEPSARDGAFEIVGLKPASYIVGAVGEGSVPEIGKTFDIVDHDLEGVIVEMAAGVTLSGRVEPAIASTVISVEPAGSVGISNMFEAMKAVLVHGEADKAGTFVLHNVPAGAFELHGAAPDGDAGSLSILVAEVDQQGLVVKLEPRASISGRVIDTSGAPVAGASVDADRRDDDKRMKISFGGGRGGATTGPDGGFKLVGLEAGKYRVRASVSNDERFAFAEKAAPSKASIDLELVGTAAKTGVTLTVEARDGVIRGVVLGPDNKPAADSWVTARRVMDKPEVSSDDIAPNAMSRFGASPPVITNADGQFTISKLRKGTYDLGVEGPRGATRGEKHGVKAGDSVTIQLASLGTLSGKVTLAGAPVGKYEIECDGKEHDAERQVDAADGAYVLERLAPGPYKCNVTSDVGTARGQIEVPAGAATLDFALTRWATVTGVVVSVLDKQPIAAVHALAGTDAFSRQSMTDMLAGQTPATDASGRFVIPRVATGKGMVMIMPKEGFQPLGTREYTAADGQHVDVGTIEVVPPRTGDAGTFGMATTVDGDKLVVAAVKEGGPAGTAGVQVGDRIKSINGRDVSSLTPPIGSTLLASGNVAIGQQAQLALDRAGTAVQVTLVSVKW